MNNTFKEFRNSFYEETEEHLIILNDNLIVLDMNKKSKKGLDSVFRVLHTLKSSAAAVELNDLGKLTHTAEDLVQNVKSGKIKLDVFIMDLLFEIMDKIHHYIVQAKDMKESEIDLQPMMNKILKINMERAGKKIKTSNTSNLMKKQSEFRLTKKDKTFITKAKKEGKTCYTLAIEIDPQEKIKWLRAELILNHLEEFSDIVTVFPNRKTILSDNFNGQSVIVLVSKKKIRQIKQTVDIDLIESFHITKIVDLEKPILLDPKTDVQDSSTKLINSINGDSLENRVTVSQTIRIPVKRLDNLLHLVGELGIINSGLKTLEKRIEDLPGLGEIHTDMNHLSDNMNKISSDLQNGIMKARMIPVSYLFNQFKRVVRDLSKKENKEVELIIQGGDTELDKNVIDTIGDPLMHMLRNAVDHGVETSKERRKKDKSSRGVITLSASQSGNHIIISMQDDGRGIDIDKVKEMAVQKGLVKKNRINEMDHADVTKFIFEPGFSTIKNVSAVSGRGIGLDVVKTGITALNGSIQVHTELGKGTEFRIILPLTLAITTVVVVKSNTSMYAVPILDIHESVKIRRTDIEDHECVKVFMHRDKVLPILDLKDVFQEDKDAFQEDVVDTDFFDDGLVPLLIIRAMDKEVGVLVDRILGKEDVMLKPLEAHYRSVNGISGAAVMGDGNIVLLIDTLQVLNNIEDRKPVLEQALKSTLNLERAIKR